MVQVYQYDFSSATHLPVSPTVENIGTRMLSVNEGGFALPFEVVSMLLLAALIGCIVIAMRSPKNDSERRKRRDFY